MKIFKKQDGFSLQVVIISTALIMTLTSTMAVLVISETKSFDRARRTKEAYALAKQGITVALASLNAGSTDAQVEDLTGNTIKGTYAVDWDSNSRVITSTAAVNTSYGQINKTVTVKLIRDPDTYKIEESYSTTNNRDTTVTGDQSVDWKTQDGFLELQQRLLATRVFQVDTADWRFVIDIEEWNGRLWVVSYKRVGATSTKQIYSSGSGDPGSWQLEWQKPIQEGDFMPQDFEIYNGNLYLITGGKQQMHPYGDVYRKSSTENFAKIKNFSAQFQRFMPYHMEAFDGKLYIVGEGYYENTVVVYDGVSFTEEVRYPTGDNYNALFAAQYFNNNVYAGGHRDYKSFVISSDGSGVGSWGAVGAPSDPKTNYINSMIEFNGYLYAGQYNQSGTFAKIWRTQDGTSWESAGQIPGTGSSRIPNVIASFEIYNNKLLAGDGTSTSRGEKAIYKSTNGTDWSLYYDFSSGGSVKAMKSFNSCLYAGTLPDGVVYRICERVDGSAYYIDGKAAGTFSINDDDVRTVRMTIYPAEGSNGSLDNFEISANGGAWNTENTSETFTNQPITRTFSGLDNGATGSLRYRFDMKIADGTESPLVDHLEIRYVTGSRYKIDYSTWRTD